MLRMNEQDCFMTVLDLYTSLSPDYQIKQIPKPALKTEWNHEHILSHKHVETSNLSATQTKTHIIYC